MPQRDSKQIRDWRNMEISLSDGTWGLSEMKINSRALAITITSANNKPDTVSIRIVNALELLFNL